MAKRHKKHHSSRRRVGAVSRKTNVSALAMKAAGLAGGVFVAGMVQKAASSLDPKISGGIMLVGGLYLSAKAKSPILEGVGAGIAAKGANSLMTSFGLINGIGSLPVFRSTPKLQNSVAGPMRNPINGAQRDLSVIGALYDN
jgi:hypothetical protein